MATRNCANASYAEVNNAVNGIAGGGGTWTGNPAVDGDIINIPAGNVTWTSSLAVTKNISIIGAGMDSTIINSVVQIFGITSNNSGFTFRLSGININVTGATASNLEVVKMGGISQMNDAGTAGGFRIDHLKFTGVLAGATYRFMWVTGWVEGVIDHCRIDQDVAQHGGENFIINHSGSPTGTGQWGDYSWYAPYVPAGSHQVYIEDCVFHRAPFCVSTLGGTTGGSTRFTARYNTTEGSISTHGTETNGRGRGSRSLELYNNNFISAGNRAEAASGQRSGCMVVFNNRISGGFANSTATVFNIFNPRLTYDSPNFLGSSGINPLDKNDRSATSVAGTSGIDDGTGDTRRGFIYATGTTGVFESLSGTVATYNLPSLSFTNTNDWSGYVLRNDVSTGSTKFAWILTSVNNGSGGTRVTTQKSDRSGTTSMSLTSGQTWDIRRVSIPLDTVGSGSSNPNFDANGILLLSQSTPVCPDPPTQRWTNQVADGVWQWGNLRRTNPGDTFIAVSDVPSSKTVYYAAGFLNVHNGQPMTIALGGPINYPWNAAVTSRVGADNTILTALEQTNQFQSLTAPGTGGWTYPHPLVGGVALGKLINVPASHDFGNIIVGETGTFDIPVLNPGDALLTVSNVTVPTGYVVAAPLNFTVAAGATVLKTATFTPVAQIPYSGNIVFTSDAASGNNSMAVTGVGVVGAGGGHGKGHKKGVLVARGR